MTGSPAPRLEVYPDRAALSTAAADKFVRLSEEAIQGRGRFTVALSGGSTPRQMYEDLAGDQFRARVDWSRVFFFWGDERAVPPDNPDSNYRMADETLLSRVPVPRENIYRIPSEKPAIEAAAEYEGLLKSFWRGELIGFDLVLLGLGSNGHTASLFPHTGVLHEESRWCVAVWLPELDANRITLTAPVLNQGLNIVFLVSGDDKSTVVREVLRGSFDPERLPAQLIRPMHGNCVWMLDRQAAGEL